MNAAGIHPPGGASWTPFRYVDGLDDVVGVGVRRKCLTVLVCPAVKRWMAA